MTLACGVEGTDCPECNKHITESVLTLEANVDQKYLLAQSYQDARHDGISRCSTHGRHL